ncbi:MAG: ribosome maturation factor RimM [Acidimicrobiales bacterium]
MPRSRSSSSTDEPLLEVGRIGRPHGVGGEVAVTLVTNRLERVAPGSVLFTDRGELRVMAARPHRGGHLVRFEGIEGRDAAATFRGLVLRAPPIDDPAELWVHDLIGAAVADQDGVERGRVVRVIDNPASDLLELDDGALVPVRFVVDVVPGDRITVEVPEGLFGDPHGDGA